MDMADEVFHIRFVHAQRAKIRQRKGFKSESTTTSFFFSGKKDVSAILSVGIGFKRC